MRTNNKILFLLHLPPPVHGSSIVGQKIKESKLINNSFRTRYINLLISRSVDESGKINPLKIIRFIQSWFKLLFEVITNKPTLCYFALSSTGSAFYKDVTLVFILKLFRIKTVFHLHNKGVKRNSINKINLLLYQYVFKNASVILLSNYLYDDIGKYVSKANIYICANGVEDNIKNNNVIFGEKTESIKLLYLSNLIKSKGVFVLIEAFKILQQKGYNFTCIFVGGEGDINESLFQSEAKKIGVANKVQYLGKKYGNDKAEIYITSDIFVLPTSNDCFPLVLLEAMQYSLPIVSTFEGGIPDVVDDGVTGFLVPQKDVQALAEKLELLIKNPELRIKMGNAGRRKYEKEFTLQIFETKLEEILQHLLLKE